MPLPRLRLRADVGVSARVWRKRPVGYQGGVSWAFCLETRSRVSRIVRERRPHDDGIRISQIPAADASGIERGTFTMTADTTFGGLSDAAWDELAGKHFYSTSKWLKFCTAETGTPGSAALSSVGDGTAWAVPLRELGGLPLWSRYRWNDRLSEFGLPLLAPTGTLVGPPEGFQTHFLSTAGDRSTSGLASLIAELRGQRQFDDASNFGSCVAMYITSEDVR